jgi:hypothetical protein
MGQNPLLKDVLAGVSDILGDNEIDISINGHRVKRCKQNKILVSMKNDNVRTNFHFSDSGFSFNQEEENPASKKSENTNEAKSSSDQIS